MMERRIRQQKAGQAYAKAVGCLRLDFIQVVEVEVSVLLNEKYVLSLCNSIYRCEQGAAIRYWQAIIRDLEEEGEEHGRSRRIKDLPLYQAIASNTSGSKPIDMIEDV
ncbi:hypothetical protein NC651_031097 [Populus alba x Populus x berolinensis]|nr:hypothetical protein NC651_031097 [Populus alba x Populus x berolinensis]